MSIPSCMRPHRVPKPETTGAADRPDQAAGCRPGSARPEAAPSRWSASCARPRPGSRRPSRRRCSSWALILLQRRHALAAGRAQLPAGGSERGAGVGQRFLFGGDRVAGGFDPVLGGAQPATVRSHLVAQLAHAADHRLVHPVQPVEVFGAGREVVDAAGADDDGDHVRAAGLVDRHQPLPQRDQGPLAAAPAVPPAAPSRAPARRPPGPAPPAWRRAGPGPLPRGRGSPPPRR